MSRKIVITGGAGFIGSALARALVARGDDVSVLDNFSSGKRENLRDLAGSLAVVEGDILDAGLLDRVFAGAESAAEPWGEPLAAARAAAAELGATRAARGALVLAGDPSRGFLDTSALELVATYRAGSDGELRPDRLKETGVYRVAG
jgi:nucleoside-diphosphate-sugar epimerase